MGIPTPTTEGQQTPTPTEQPVVEQTSPAKPAQDDSGRWAQMARREKMLRSKAQEVQQRELQLKAREAELSNKAPQVDESWKQKLQDDPLTFLTEQGMTYEQLTERIVNSNPLDPQVKILKSQLAKMEQDQAKIMQSLEERDKTSYQQALTMIGQEVKQTVASNDEYEVVRASGEQGQKAVVKLIEKTFQEEGVMLSVEEALKEVEDYMTEQYLEIAKLKKIQSRLTPKQVIEEGKKEVKFQAKSEPKVTPRNAPQTLSHTIQQQSKPLTDKDRVQRAILAFQGKLQG